MITEKIKNSLWILLLPGMIMMVSCAGIRFDESAADHAQEVHRLGKILQSEPENAGAWRDIGVISFETRAYARAARFLERAHELNGQDPKTMLYLGLSREFDNDEEGALQIYRRYMQVSRVSPYRNLMSGRFNWIKRQLARREAEALLAQPADVGQIIPQAIAVFPMKYRGDNDRFVPLGRGLSEMILVDLSRVSGLLLVERIRIQSLLDELARTSGTEMDLSTAPREGRLLRAERIVGGIYQVHSDEKLLVDMSVWDTADSELPSVSKWEDQLNDLFSLEKKLVFEILDRLDIELTPEERRQIMQVPTRNLHSFLAYSMGLQEEDLGRFSLAVEHYREAARLDPAFLQVQLAADRAHGLNAAGGDAQTAAGAIQAAAGAPAKKGQSVGASRAQSVGANVGSIFAPGEDSGNPMSEVINSGLVPLTEPPDPPDASPR